MLQSCPCYSQCIGFCGHEARRTHQAVTLPYNFKYIKYLKILEDCFYYQLFSVFKQKSNELKSTEGLYLSAYRSHLNCNFRQIFTYMNKNLVLHFLWFYDNLLRVCNKSLQDFFPKIFDHLYIKGSNIPGIQFLKKKKKKIFPTVCASIQKYIKKNWLFFKERSIIASYVHFCIHTHTDTGTHIYYNMHYKPSWILY